MQDMLLLGVFFARTLQLSLLVIQWKLSFNKQTQIANVEMILFY